MRHRCLLGAREISTLAKSVSIDNHEPLAKSKLELLTLFGLLWTWWGVNAMITIFMIALVLVMALALGRLRRTDENPR